MHTQLRLAISGLLFTACTDYGFTKATEPGHPLTPDTGTLDTGEVSPPPEEQPPEEPPPEPEPPEWIEDCDDGIEIEILPEETYVLAWNQSEANASLEAPSAGWYHIYDHALAESGASQRNESVYLRIPNADHPDGLPRYANCERDWIVLDADNQSTPGSNSRQYIGTFWLAKGHNDVELNHYCPLYRSGQCDSFHDTVDANATCDSNNVNSAHLLGKGVCMKPM